MNALTKNKSDRWIAWTLFAIAFLVYSNTLRFGYVWDDSIVITENPYVQKGISGIPQLFVKHNSEYKADKYGYRPITLTSFAIEISLFGNNPTAGHFMNVLFFALLCMVMYNTLRLLFSHHTNLAPFLITLLFALHPVHTEVVANIKSRDEIFALLFALLSLRGFIKYLHSGTLSALLFSVLFFVLAFLSKENAAIFLAVFPLTFFYLRGFKELKKLIVPLLTLLVLGAITLLVLKLTQPQQTTKSASAGAGVFVESGLLGNSFFYSDLLNQKLANAFVLLLLYLNNFFFPLKQLYFYGYNQVPVASWSEPSVYVSLLITLALLLFALMRIGKKDPMAFGILFYFLAISVYLHLFRTLADTMADRFLFMPSMGLCIFFVFMAGNLFKTDFSKLELSSLLRTPKSNVSPVFRFGFILIIVLLATKTYSRNRVWKDNVSLVSTDLPALENCARAHNYYADELKRRLYNTFNEATEKEMITHYRKAIAITKESYYSFLGLATYYCDTKKYPQGIGLLDTMVMLFPNTADPYFYLGQAQYYTQDYASAVKNLEQSLTLAPDVLSTYYVLSISYSRNNAFDKAFATIKKAQEKFSESAKIYEALGNIYFDQRNMPECTRATLEMLRFGADPQKVYGVVIGRYQYLKQDSLAAKYYNEALSKGIFRR